MIRWGVVATIKAAQEDVLQFAAHHLSLGAHRVYIYLDEPDPETATRLRGHPKVRVIETDARWWHRQGGRPARHQRRQERNGQHAYRKTHGLDWLAHIDVDEYLYPNRPVHMLLADIPKEVSTARVLPMEALVGKAGYFKTFHTDHARRQSAAERLYPTYGRYLPGGFVSHIAGKAFLRTGLADIEVRIHGLRRNGLRNPNEVPLAGIALAHVHARSWEHWRAQFGFRHAKGSYRADLPAQMTINRHTLFQKLLDARGEEGLRHFFDEVMHATPAHIDALRAEGLLRCHNLDLKTTAAALFPEQTGAAAQRFDSKAMKTLQGTRML